MLPLLPILLYLAAVLIGIALGMLGGGGGILAIPALVYLGGVAPTMATTYSLFVVGVSASGGAVQYARRGSLQWQPLLHFALPSLATVVLARRVLLPLVPDTLLSIGEHSISRDLVLLVAFGLLVLAAASSMLRNALKKPQAAAPAPSQQHSLQPWRLALLGAGTGMVTGMLGAGGGFLIVPALVLLAGLPMAQAVGSSLFIIAANALLGFALDPALPLVNWPWLLAFTGFALGGMAAGSYLGRLVQPARLKVAFSILLLVVGTGVVVAELTKLLR